MAKAYHGRSLGKLLIEEGVLPADLSVRDAVITIPTDGALTMTIDVFLGDKQLEGVRRAINRLLTEVV